MTEQSRLPCRFCGSTATIYDSKTMSHFCAQCKALDDAIHVKVEVKNSQPLCWTCRKPARVFCLAYERYYCADCTQDRLAGELDRGELRRQLIAFDSFTCTHCGSHDNRPSFTPSKEEENDWDCKFAGWRTCNSCSKNYIENDHTFFAKARITPYIIGVVAGETEET
jgi:hypothetical protein